MKTLAIFVACVLTLSGCTTVRMGSLTLTSTKNLGETYVPLQKQVSGENCTDDILGIPLGTLNPNLQDAIDDAVEKVPNGDMMTNVTIHKDLFVTIVFNQLCVRVNGDVVASNAPQMAAGTPIFATKPVTSTPPRPAPNYVPNPNVDQRQIEKGF